MFPYISKFVVVFGFVLVKDASLGAWKLDPQKSQRVLPHKKPEANTSQMLLDTFFPDDTNWCYGSCN